MRTSRPLEAGSPTHSFLCKMESFSLHSQWRTYQSKETGSVHTVGPFGLPRPKKGQMAWCVRHIWIIQHPPTLLTNSYGPLFSSRAGIGMKE